jgi:hypothetical protein
MRGKSDFRRWARAFDAPVHNEAKQVFERLAQITGIEGDNERHHAASDTCKKRDPDDSQWANAGAESGQKLNVAGPHPFQGEERQKKRQTKHPPCERDASRHPSARDPMKDHYGHGATKGKDIRNSSRFQIERHSDERNRNGHALKKIHGQVVAPGSGVHADKPWTPLSQPEYFVPMRDMMFVQMNIPAKPMKAVSRAYSIRSCPDSSRRKRNQVALHSS